MRLAASSSWRRCSRVSREPASWVARSAEAAARLPLPSGVTPAWACVPPETAAEYWLTAAVTAPAWRLSRGPSDGQVVAAAAVLDVVRPAARTDPARVRMP